MAKRYTKKKKTYKKKQAVGFFNKKFSVSDMAASAWNGVKYIKTLINVEKHIHIRGEASTVTQAGNVYNLCAIAQGDGVGQRTGLSILCRSLTFRIHFVHNMTATRNMIRYMIVQDTQQVADTNPGVLDILESDWQSGLNRNTMGRFKILRNAFVNVSTNANPQVFHDEFIDLTGQHIRYNGPNSGDVTKDGIYLVILGDNGTSLPSFSYNSRLHYYDN